MDRCQSSSEWRSLHSCIGKSCKCTIDILDYDLCRLHVLVNSLAILRYVSNVLRNCMVQFKYNSVQKYIDELFYFWEGWGMGGRVKDYVAVA